MCGINGIFAYHYAANPVDRDELRATRDYMKKRGPDGSGSWISQDGALGLGHRRLAIIDLSEAGEQPMISADRRFVVTFNGEIYNYREIRRRLEAKGIRFRSNSDTEVLLNLYADRGSAMLDELRGMFALAIWDERERTLFLARDPLGIKPLYYADDGWTFRFASQVKALQAGGAVGADPDPAAFVGFHLWGNVPEPFTTLLAVRSLPAGCHAIVDRVGARAPVRYHSVAEVYCKAEQAEHDRVEPQAKLRAAMLDSVRHHLEADVPVGLFLSGGIDSGALAGLMRDVGHSGTQSVTLSFEEFRGTANDESAAAAQLAQLYSTRHTEYVVTRGEFEADLPRIIAAMDQPSIDGINSWFVSKGAAALGLKVAISGLGGDELLGGYSSFRDLPRWVARMALPSKVPGAGQLLQHTMSYALAGRKGINPKAAGMLKLGGSYPGAYLLRRGVFMPWELRELLPRDMIVEGIRRLGTAGGAAAALNPCPRSAFGKVAALETQLYLRNQLLRDVDWASMAHSLEVRVPLVDAPLLEQVAPMLVNGRIKSGKRAFAATPSTPLPSSLVSRSKTGFSTPIADWQLGLLGSSGAGRATPSEVPWARQWAIYIARQHAF